MSKRKVIAHLQTVYGKITGIKAPDGSIYDASPVIIETTLAPNDLMATEVTTPEGIKYRLRTYSPSKKNWNDHIGHYYTIAFQLI